MRWILILMVLVLAGCSIGSDDDARSDDELMDQAVAKFCHEQPESVCRANADELLDDLATESITRGDVLAHMVDTLDPDSLEEAGIPRMAYAVLESFRQLSFHVR